MRYLLFLLCLLTALLAAQPTPEHHLPLPYSTDLLAIDVADNNRGFAAGTCGYLLTTTNGQDWTVTESPTADDITHLACRPGTDCQQVFFIADRTLYRSLDGGTTWTNAAIPGNGTTQGIIFTGDDQTVIVSRNVTTFTYSPDNGNTFEQTSMGNAPATLTQFVTPQRGFFFSNMTDLITTADGGQTWQNLYDHEEGVRKMSFVDELIGYMYSGSGIVFKTTDGGNNWAEVGTYADIRFLVAGMTAYSETEIELVTSRGVHRSTDGGATFTELININSNSNQFNDVRVEDLVRRGDEYWIAGLNTSILYTADDLMTVNHQLGPDRTPFNALALSGDNIIALTSQDGIARSTDGGQTFTVPDLPLFAVLGNNIEYLQDGRIIVTGNGSSFVSEDDGSSWSSYRLPAGSPSIGFAKFKQLESGRLVFIAADGVCAYSDDNGDNWSFSDHGLGQNPSGMSVAGSVIGVNNRDSLAVSYDGGATWPVLQQNNENFGAQPRIFMVDAETWLVSRFPGGQLSRTDDGGVTWTSLDVNAVHIVDDGNGRLYGINSNGIIFSDHAGAGWETVTEFCSPFGLTFAEIAYDPAGQRIFAAGRGRRIFSVDVSDVVANTRDVVLPQPLRVFPNPSSGAVSVEMPEGSGNERVSVQLVTATGRVAWQRQMVSGPRLDLAFGTQPAGIYYLRVAGQGWIRTGRIVLRK